MFSAPPGTVDQIPVARLDSPPPTVADSPVALLSRPPLTVVPWSPAMLRTPPPTVAPGASEGAPALPATVVGPASDRALVVGHCVAARRLAGITTTPAADRRRVHAGADGVVRATADHVRARIRPIGRGFQSQRAGPVHTQVERLVVGRAEEVGSGGAGVAAQAPDVRDRDPRERRLVDIGAGERVVVEEGVLVDLTARERVVGDVEPEDRAVGDLARGHSAVRDLVGGHRRSHQFGDPDGRVADVGDADLAVEDLVGVDGVVHEFRPRHGTGGEIGGLHLAVDDVVAEDGVAAVQGDGATREGEEERERQHGRPASCSTSTHAGWESSLHLGLVPASQHVTPYAGRSARRRGGRLRRISMSAPEARTTRAYPPAAPISASPQWKPSSTGAGRPDSNGTALDASRRRTGPRTRGSNCTARSPSRRSTTGS